MNPTDPITLTLLDEPQQTTEAPVNCRWEAECTCPDFCERDHERD